MIFSAHAILQANASNKKGAPDGAPFLFEDFGIIF